MIRALLMLFVLGATVTLVTAVIFILWAIWGRRMV